MNRHFLLATLLVILMLLEGCQQNHLTRTFIEASSIPEQTYDVTVYKRFMSKDYAVLFDIPDDSVEVFMRRGSFTEKIGRRSPDRYIDEFQNRIGYYRTISIGDQDGTVRGYLMVSSVLNYWISPAGDRIMVGVERETNYSFGGP